MKRRISVFTVSVCCILLFFCLSFGKAAALHGKYPDPPVRTCQYGEGIRIGSYRMLFGGWQWGNESLIKTEFPDFTLAYADEDGLTADVRIGLLSFTVTKISQGEDILDLTQMGFSSGAWGNQFDLELFHLLNPEISSPLLNLTDGGTQEIILPMTMLETQFTAAQWKDIDNREFYINVQYYPEHVRFLCPCGSDSVAEKVLSADGSFLQAASGLFHEEKSNIRNRPFCRGLWVVYKYSITLDILVM